MPAGVCFLVSIYKIRPMDSLITSLLHRYKQFNNSFLLKPIFINQPWVILNPSNDIDKIVFKRKNTLLISNNGIVAYSRWEYEKTLKALLIDFGFAKMLLKPEFIENGILILTHENSKEIFMILVNQNIIPNLNIETYLKKIFYQRNNVMKLKSKNNETYEVIHSDKKKVFPQVGSKVFQNFQEVKDCSFFLSNYETKVYLKNSKIFEMSRILVRSTRNGKKLHIECFLKGNQYINIGKGDIVRNSDNDLVEDGIYKIGLFKKIKVVNGKII